MKTNWTVANRFEIVIHKIHYYCSSVRFWFQLSAWLFLSVLFTSQLLLHAINQNYSPVVILIVPLSLLATQLYSVLCVSFFSWPLSSKESSFLTFAGSPPGNSPVNSHQRHEYLTRLIFFLSHLPSSSQVASICIQQNPHDLSPFMNSFYLHFCDRGRDGLHRYCSEGALWASSISITGKLVKGAESQAPPQAFQMRVFLTNPPGSFIGTFKSEKHYSAPFCYQGPEYRLLLLFPNASLRRWSPVILYLYLFLLPRNGGRPPFPHISYSFHFSLHL